jgi:Alpha/beta hydrolase domain
VVVTNRFMQILPLLLLGAWPSEAAYSAAAAQLAVTPRAVIVPITPTNRPFLAASQSLIPVNLQARGYVEEELRVSGNADVYQWQQGSGQATVLARQAAKTPYSTRILVRRPLDATKFSGRVVVELLNPTGSYDMAPLWGYSWEYFLRRGDIWVGVTVKPVAVKALQRFDAVRYAGLTFAYKQPATCAATPNSPDNFNDAENGLAWDLIAQVGALLRSSSKENPLLKYDPQRIVVAGYSQTGGYVRTYAQLFHRQWRLGNDKPVFDAYVNATGTQAMPINQCDPSPQGAIANGSDWSDDSSALVEIMTQSELDRDLKSTLSGDLYRLYEISGAVHWGSFAAGQPANADLSIAGVPVPGALPCRDSASEYQTKFALNAIWQQLDERLVAKMPMTGNTSIARTSGGQAQVDELGNAKGGWRVPAVDVPMMQFLATNSAKDAQPFSRVICQLVGASKQVGVDQLKKLYGTRVAYSRRLDAAIELAVRERRLLRDDGPALKSSIMTGLPQF